MPDIHPDFQRLKSRRDKESLLNQRGCVVWMTGLSGSGKSTIAAELENRLYEMGFLTQVLDGDNIRFGLNNNLGFSEEERMENIRRIAEVSKLFMQCGIICINSFISPTIQIRKMAYDIIGRENVIEMFINTPIEVCEQRDVKGLYRLAREGKIKHFTGIDSPFEAPLQPDIEINTVNLTIEEAIKKCLEHILPLITRYGKL